MSSLSHFLLVAWLAVAAPALAADAPATQSPRRVALTFDDLPAAGLVDAPRDPALTNAAVASINRDLLAALSKVDAPAVGFVVEAHVAALGADGPRLLREWTHGSLSLGNHTRNHRDSNTLSIDEIDAEITGGSISAGAAMRDAGKTLCHIRFPLNHTGDTSERRAAIAALVDRHGLVAAASTIDTSDYLFDRAYGRALAANDRDLAVKVRMAYLDYSDRQIDYYAALNAKVLGYAPPEVMLLHANRLNADVMPQLLDLFAKKRYRFVTLGEAQADPAYRTSATYASKFGPMWGYRWARERGVKVDGSLETEPPAWVAEYAEKGTLLQWENPQ